MWWSALLQFYRPVLKGISRWTCWHNSFRVGTSRFSVKMVRTHFHILFPFFFQKLDQDGMYMYNVHVCMYAVYPHHIFVMCYFLFTLNLRSDWIWFSFELNHTIKVFFGNLFEFICSVQNLFLNKSSKNSFPQIHSSCHIILKSTFSIEFDADETVFWNFFEFLFLFWIFFSINRLKLFWNPHFLLDLRLMKLFSGIPPKWQNFPYHSLWPSQMEPPFKILKNYNLKTRKLKNLFETFKTFHVVHSF